MKLKRYRVSLTIHLTVNEELDERQDCVMGPLAIQVLFCQKGHDVAADLTICAFNAATFVATHQRVGDRDAQILVELFDNIRRLVSALIAAQHVCTAVLREVLQQAARRRGGILVGHWVDVHQLGE